MSAKQIIDKIADDLGYSREGFKDVVPSLTRFNALLQTLNLSPEEIREAINAYPTYIASQKVNISTQGSKQDADEDETPTPNENTNPTDDLSDILNSLNDTNESVDLSGARPIDQDEDMDGNASPQPNPDNDNIFNEEAMRGQGKGQGKGQGEGQDGDGDGEDGDDGDGDGGQGEGQDGDGDGDEDGEDGDGGQGEGQDGDGDGEDGDGDEDGEDGDKDSDKDGDDGDEDEDDDNKQPPPPPKQPPPPPKPSPDEQRADELQKIIDEAILRRDAFSDDNAKTTFDRIIDNATSLKTKLETQPCQSTFTLPFYLREFWEEIAKPTLYESFSARKYTFDLAFFTYDDETTKYFKNTQKKISSIAINSYSNCASEYAMTHGKSNMLPLYLSRKHIDIELFGASLFSTKKDAFRPIIYFRQNEKIQGENNSYDIFQFSKRLRDVMKEILKEYKNDLTNTKAIEKFKVVAEIDFRADILDKELNQIFTIKYTDINNLSDLMRYTRGYTSLNDSFLTYEKYAVECNKIILFILAYDFYLTKNQITLI